MVIELIVFIVLIDSIGVLLDDKLRPFENVFKLVTVTDVVEHLEIIALVVGEIVDFLVAETEDDGLNNDVVVTDDDTDDVLVILTSADRVGDDDRVTVAERLSSKPEEVTD